jgi:outer membrane protein assembly factor BamD (BamD/ComL family)
MARQRFRRKDLKKPDEFVSQGRAFLEWAQTNARTLAWAVAGFAIAVVLVAGLVSLRSARLRQANEDLAQALQTLEGGRYAEAATQLTGVAERWQATPVGQLAELLAALSNIRANNLDAGSRLADIAAGVEPTPYLHQQAVVGLAYSLERKGDLQGAAGRYAEAAGVEGPYTGLALLGEARCRSQLGDQDKARTLYDTYVQRFPQAPDSDLVRSKLGPANS